MNRKIKFRGKSIDEWVYGMLLKVNEGDIEHGEPLKYSIQTDEKEYGEYNKYFITDDNTIGQFTGLHDKNGKEIYEGDIVTEYDYPFIDEDGKQNYIGIVEFYENAAQYGFTLKCVNKAKRGISSGINEEFEANNNLICEDLEVIGNIYDNPELLGGE